MLAGLTLARVHPTIPGTVLLQTAYDNERKRPVVDAFCIMLPVDIIPSDHADEPDLCILLPERCIDRT